MRIILNDTEVIFPSSLSEITLSQRIAYHNEHGRELDEMLQSIMKMPDGIEKELESTHFHFEKMFRTFAFFAGTTVEAIKESQFIDEVANIYYSCLAVLVEDEQKVELEPEIIWNGEIWQIDPPELSNGSKMTFGQFIDGKQIVKDLVDLGAGKWEYMQYLCAIYLRKKGEKYKKELTQEDSPRMKLMLDLPMNIAMQVGFFLSGITNSSITTLSYLENQESKEPVNT